MNDTLERVSQVHRDTVVIGASAGGVSALRSLLRGLPANLPAALFVVLHQSAEASELTQVLQAASPVAVERVDSEREIRNGRVYVAPPDRHLVLAGNRVLCTRGPHEMRTRPAINPLFRTAAASHGARVIAVQLSGMLSDGVAGLAAVRRCGGLVLVQDPDEAAFPEMPQSALDAVEVDHVGTLSALSTLLPVLVREIVPLVKIPPDIALEARLACGNATLAGDPDLGLSLLVAIQALDERTATLTRMADGAERAKPKAAAAYRERAVESRAHGERLRRFLLTMSAATAPPLTGADAGDESRTASSGTRRSGTPMERTSPAFV